MKGWTRKRLLALGEERGALRKRICSNELTPEDQRLLLFLVRITPWLLERLKKKTQWVSKLRELLWGKKSESARDILKEVQAEEASGSLSPPPAAATESADASPALSASALERVSSEAVVPENVIPIGKGKYPENRNSSPRGRNAYPDAETEIIEHQDLKKGDPCPKCKKGRVYPIKMGVFLKWLGGLPLRVSVFLQEKFRCNACEWIFAAKMPAEATSPEGSEGAVAMIALLKYGCALPFFRLSKLQGWLKMPISSSALWNQVKEGLVEVVEVVWLHLRFLAAQGEIIHNDDTIGKILSLLKRAKKDSSPPGIRPKIKPRKAISTTGILSKVGGKKILLFFTGHANAGENLEELLKARDRALKVPIQMSDAGSTNHAGEEKTEESLCLTHGRRGFIRAYRSAKKACAWVILKLQAVYKVEAEAKRKGLNPEQRLALHQEKSAPVMQELKTWFDDQIDSKKVEPNSPLGEAIQYMRNHWEGLTAFLRIAGAPLTNDELEQAFKAVKMHLKNALFYKTLFGARVGDMMMSVIQTTVLAGENPWEYLVEIQRNREAVKKNPGAWMPWNFRQALCAGKEKIGA